MIPPRMGTINKTDNNMCWQDVEKLEFSYIVGRNVKWSSHFGKSVWQFFKELNIKLPYDPVTPLSCVPRRNKIIGSHEHLNVNIHSNIIHSKKVERT